MKSSRFLLHAAWIAACAALAAPTVFAQGVMGGDRSGYSRGQGRGWGYGMMGGGHGMMGAIANDRPVAPGWGGAVWSYAQVKRYLSISNTEGTVDGKTVRFRGPDVTIDMVAVQPGHPDGTFEVRGVTNPTLVVPAGATVHLNLVNMDYGHDMEHGVVMSAAPPPYGGYAMMLSGPGLARIAPPIPWRSSEDLAKSSYAGAGTTFIAPPPGIYWYICQTPGHAAKGMYGKFVVKRD